MQVDKIRALVADDMKAVDQVIQARLSSDVVLVLRPLLSLMASRAYGYEGRHHHTLAAIIEFIHTATLLHDDVVDESELRRGRKTANALFGNAASVLVGDFLYSRAFEMMVDVGKMQVMQILAETTNVIAEGEVMQLMNCHDADTTEQRYLDVIHAKTAKLFEAATRLGAVLCDRPKNEEQAMAAYGMHLGTAFQLIDDVLDYSSSSEEMGKNVGDDLAEGKPTLPLIYAMRNGTQAQSDVVRKAIEEGGLEYLDAVMEAIRQTGAIEYTEKTARQEARLAISQLAHLPDSEYSQAMQDLAKYAVDRSF